MHIGRSWGGGGHLEAACPCPLELCGLVDLDKVSDECDQHSPAAGKTTRTGHRSGDCPGVGRDVVVAIGRTAVAHQAVIDAACLESSSGYVNASILGALDDYRAAVEHEAAERIRAETQHAKAMGVLEPDKFRPCRDAADQIDPEATYG
ncbi:hypothetical protein [Streptomyces sp. MH60]|uniref:hypothetical protein n=1 Tax=Streptomyces sp. MH60 TaxID=1940758 RepID=UPI000CEEB8E8|nr:hypothetical protein [Streptomyces sp. MH60]PPS86437.1 hypothetical protein BZZ08_03404 [Streptomyces sp. MH60]